MNNNEPIEVKTEIVQPPQPIEPKAQAIGKAAEKVADSTIKGTKAVGSWFKSRLSVAADKLDRKVNKDKYKNEQEESEAAFTILQEILQEKR